MAYQKKDTWKYWIPGYGHYLWLKDTIESKNPFAGPLHSLGIETKYDKEQQSGQIQEASEVQTILDNVEQVSADNRQEFLEDRDHTEEREDTAYQRAVADMQKAGLNPYTVGSSPSPSSSSNVGQNTIGSKLQLLGYVLDLKNLSVKNKQVSNQAIGNLLKLVK